MPSALAQILLLLGVMEQHSIGPEWLEVMVGSWEEQAGQAAFLGQEGDVGSAHPCVLLGGATPGLCSGKCLWNDQSCADADWPWHLQDLLMLNSACDLEKLCFQFSIISRTSTHAVSHL